MVANVRQGVVVKQRLTAQDLTDLRYLADLCNVQEHLAMRIDYNMLRGHTEIR